MVSPRKKLHAEDYDALAAFRYAMRKFLRFSKDLLAQSALTPEQYEAMLALKAFSSKGGLTVGRLSERLQVRHHTAISLVDRLAKRNLVMRKPGKDDRREVYVKLTRTGSALLSAVATIHRQEIRLRSREMIAALERLAK